MSDSEVSVKSVVIQTLVFELKIIVSIYTVISISRYVFPEYIYTCLLPQSK